MAKKKQVDRSTPRSTTPKTAAPRPVERVAAPTPAAPIRPAASASRPASAPARPVTASARPAEASVTLPIDNRPITWWPSALLALIAVALYANTFDHKYALDDIAAVGQNLFVKQGFKGIPDLLRTEFWHFSNISLGYYRPLSLITFAIEQEYFKDSPGISHIINTLLYGLTGVGLGALLQKWLPGQPIVAFLIGLLFIAHPIHTEIVANIKGRDELLSFLFITTMLLAYWRYLETKQWGWISLDALRITGGILASLAGGILGGCLAYSLIAKTGVSLPTQIESGVDLREICKIAAGAVVGNIVATAALSLATARKQEKPALWWNSSQTNTLVIGALVTTLAGVLGAVAVAKVLNIADITTGKAIWTGLGASAGSLLVTSWMGLACLSLYLAFLSKESSIVSLAFIPAAQYFFARRSVWQSSISVWPFLIVAALFFYQKQKMIGTLSGTPPVDWANYPYAIQKTQTSTMFKFLAYYIRLLVVPTPLVYDYSYNVIPSGGKGDILTWVGFFSLVGLGWLTVKGIMQRTLWGFGLVWFFVSMIPGLGFILSRGGIFAERFAYAAVLGLAFIVVWAGQHFLVKSPGTTLTGNADDTVVKANPSMLVRYAPLLALLAVVTGLYSFKTVTRNPDWKDNFTLFNSALPAAENSCQVQRHVANEWIEKGVKTKALMDTLNKKLANPKFVAKPDSVKAAQIGLDTLNKATNRYARWALDHLQLSCRIYPNFGESYFSMAYVFQRITPNRDSAVYYYKQTIRAANAYAPAYNNLGVIYQNEGKYQLASYYYNRSMAVNPAYADGRNNWANLKKQTGMDVKILPDSVLSKN